jgi:hypothetical protein
MDIVKKLKKYDKSHKEVGVSSYDYHEFLSYLKTPDLENTQRWFLCIMLFHLWGRDEGWMTNAYLSKITGREISTYFSKGMQRLCDLDYLKRKLERKFPNSLIINNVIWNLPDF